MEMDIDYFIDNEDALYADGKDDQSSRIRATKGEVLEERDRRTLEGTSEGTSGSPSESTSKGISKGVSNGVFREKARDQRSQGRQERLETRALARVRCSPRCQAAAANVNMARASGHCSCTLTCGCCKC